jgi:hypothetical protein
MKFKSNTPIFLVGCPRSGTTLLQSLLSAHPQIASFPESKFFQCLLPAENSRRRKLGIISHQLKPWLATYFKNDIKRPEMLRYLPKFPLRRLYTQQFFKILLMLATEQGKNIVLEKTPQHIFYLDPITDSFPHAKIIHLIRKGEDVVASLYEATHQSPQYWDGIWEIDKCIDWWNRAVYMSQQYADHPNHILVSYEQLLETPEIFLQDLCTFLKIGYDTEMIKNYGKASQSLILAAGGRTVNPTQIQSSNSDKFHKIFTEKQQSYIFSHLKKFSF